MVKLINLAAFGDFIRSGSAGGFLLIACLIVSLALANSPWGPGFEQLLAQQIGFQSKALSLQYSVLMWINDGLMAVFFLLVGLEIKRELLEGELSFFRQAALPVFAALGGMLVPAAIYFSSTKAPQPLAAGASPWLPTSPSPSPSFPSWATACRYPEGIPDGTGHRR